jgi:hypothetical protein
MKVSEIRAKFPMYDDLSDDQLIIGVHKKFYSDIPLGKFTQKIEYDTSRIDPTEGMGTVEKLVAGYGKAGADIVRGIGQYTPFVSREDVAESRKLDAPLMRTGAGMTGNIAGNIAALAPTAFIPGAATLPLALFNRQPAQGKRWRTSVSVVLLRLAQSCWVAVLRQRIRAAKL